MHLGMVIDKKKCFGCQTCAVACKAANNLPNQVWWNRVQTIEGEYLDTPSGDYPNLSLEYVPLNCQHCENPHCVAVCPAGATYKREEDGVVIQDYDICIGCKLCIEACPYTGVRTYNEDEPQFYVDFALGDEDVAPHKKNVVEKCTFCVQRLARGETPACMELCPGRARYWGDLDDPDSKVAQLIKARTYEQLLPEVGTRPSVYYLI